MKTVFLGDSFTSGDNVDYSFADAIPGTTYNLGISGTTIGEYSIYPVDGNSLLSVINRSKDIIKRADRIVIEYGINDVTAIMCGFTTLKTVTISLVKALDMLKQINAGAKISFLVLSNDYDIITMFAESQCAYLENEYFSKFKFKFSDSVWASTYAQFANIISECVDVVEMFPDKFEWEGFIDSKDNLHPNYLGYKYIASNIVECI